MTEKINITKENGETFTAEPLSFFELENFGKYLVYTLREVDSNNLETLHITKVTEEDGETVGNTITDDNEWNAVKNALKTIIAGGQNGQ